MGFNSRNIGAYNSHYGFSFATSSGQRDGMNCDIKGDEFITNKDHAGEWWCPLYDMTLQFFSNNTAPRLKCQGAYPQPAPVVAEESMNNVQNTCYPFCDTCYTGECKECQKCIGKIDDPACDQCFTGKWNDKVRQYRSCLYRDNTNTGCVTCWREQYQ